RLFDRLTHTAVLIEERYWNVPRHCIKASGLVHWDRSTEELDQLKTAPKTNRRCFAQAHFSLTSAHSWTSIGQPLFFQIEQEMMRHMQEMRHNLEFMERLHQRIFDEIDHVSPMTTFKPISFQIGKEGSHYALMLDTKDFSPEELGKTEKKQDDGKGSFSYRCQEFRQEFDLPEGVNPEMVTCSLNNGQLQIQAPKEASAVSNERVVPITYTPASPQPQLESQAAETEATNN
ncbi:hypothetical protein M9458_042255, partial [Cirrhinus mrigala]